MDKGLFPDLKVISEMFSVNFPVVAGGFALLAATGATQAIVGGSTVFTTSVIGGATGLLGKASS